MSEGDLVETDIKVRGRICKVTAQKFKKAWKASGTLDGKLVEVFRAATAAQAFEWWTNKAEMQQPNR
jgi:hypothetical protein